MTTAASARLCLRGRAGPNSVTSPKTSVPDSSARGPPCMICTLEAVVKPRGSPQTTAEALYSSSAIRKTMSTMRAKLLSAAKL
jgi:hypothetical protein